MGEAQRAVQVLASLVNLRFYLPGFVPGPSGNFKSKGLLKPTGKKGTSWVLEFWGHHLSARPGPGVGKPVLLHAAGHWGGVMGGTCPAKSLRDSFSWLQRCVAGGLGELPFSPVH